MPPIAAASRVTAAPSLPPPPIRSPPPGSLYMGAKSLHSSPPNPPILIPELAHTSMTALSRDPRQYLSIFCISARLHPLDAEASAEPFSSGGNVEYMRF